MNSHISYRRLPVDDIVFYILYYILYVKFRLMLIRLLDYMHLISRV